MTKQGAEYLVKRAMEYGMGLRDIAKAAGVSASRLRQLRDGSRTDNKAELNLERLMSFLESLKAAGFDDPVQWLEVDFSLPVGYSVKPMELYHQGHSELLLAIAQGQRTAESVLNEIEPAWRKERYSRNEVIVASDGYKSIVPREG